MIPTSSLEFLTKAIESEFDAADEAGAAQEAAAAPQVFVRTLSAPPGWPWEQSRSADLEARHGAPLPLSELLYRVRRLEAWRPGAAARFAAFYVLARDVDDQLEAHSEVDGRDIAVTFGRARGQGARAGRLALLAVGAAAVLLLLTVATGEAFAKRADATTALDATERQVAAKLRRLQSRERQADEVRLLKQQPDRGASLGEVVKDLAWLSAEKTPDAHIEALHWRGGLMALEARGAQPPVDPMGERRVERAPRPLRKGVWLWGVAPAAESPSAAPLAARPLEGGRP